MQPDQPDSDETVCWIRIAVEDLDSIKPKSLLAKKILETAVLQQSMWREAYVNAVERLIINPNLMVFEDAPITETVTTHRNDEDGIEDKGAYVMCWQFVPEKAVIPPEPDTPAEMQRSLAVLKQVSKLLE
ncbi:MAG: hypothetical protein EBZ69_00485 [Alphaproteobacteria bacterium]|nr:hypothetical protein [Alphaproteobacteria bacterium]